MEKKSAFSLMELMVVVAIIGILVAVALPSYHRYTLRARFSQIVQATSPYQLGVAECLHVTGQLSGCNNAVQGIPTSISNDLISSIKVENGIITATPQNKYGLTGDELLILSPNISQEQLNWSWSGKAITKGLVNSPRTT